MEPFRFLDLPPELRTKVYEYLLEEKKPIRIRTYTARRRRVRPVRHTFDPGYNKAKEVGFDPWEGKWHACGPSNLAIAQVCTQTAQEALPVVYSNNTFEFIYTSHLAVFLEMINSMRTYLRHISLPTPNSWTKGKNHKRHTVFDRLSLAVDLRTLKINHRTICRATGAYDNQQSIHLDELAIALKPFMKRLHESLNRKGSTINALDVVEITGEECGFCAEKSQGRCSLVGCVMKCNDGKIQEHCKEVTQKLRALLAAELKIEQ